MATYGSRDSGNFSYSHLQNVRYYTKIDSVTGEITLKSTTVADPNVEGAFVPSGSESDDISIKSSPARLALLIASSKVQIPTCAPFSSINLTLVAFISSFILGSFFFLILCFSLFH